MPWFRNHYRCARCHGMWSDEWSAMCDDDCPFCGARHMSPTKSDDLTVITVERDRGRLAVLRSPETAEHSPNYEEVGVFPSPEAAAAFIAEIDGSPNEIHRTSQPQLARCKCAGGAP